MEMCSGVPLRLSTSISIYAKKGAFSGSTVSSPSGLGVVLLARRVGVHHHIVGSHFGGMAAFAAAAFRRLGTGSGGLVARVSLCGHISNALARPIGAFQAELAGAFRCGVGDGQRRVQSMRFPSPASAVLFQQRNRTVKRRAFREVQLFWIDIRKLSLYCQARLQTFQ